MGDKTSIQWTEATWNPIRGCSRVSEGCRNCYAERTAARQIHGAYAGLVKSTFSGPRWTGEVRFVEEALDLPLRWKAPRRIFVNSMSDLFHESLTDDHIMRVFGVMGGAFWHTYQVLTKRAGRMRDVLSRIGPRLEAEGRAPLGAVWKHVHLGVSVEDQATADERIPLLLQTPAAVRWVSYEPALAAVDFRSWLTITAQRPYCLDWIVVGGESGPGARPFDLAWARQTIAQCRAAGVPVFVKQLGAFPFDGAKASCTRPPCVVHDYTRLRLSDRKGGDTAEWPEDLRVREYPA